MTCSACESAHSGADDPEALLDRVTDERALVLQVEICGELQTITLRQTDKTDQYQSKWRIEDSAQAEQTTCWRAEVLALVGKILRASGYLGAEYHPVEEVWHRPARSNRPDETDGDAR